MLENDNEINNNKIENDLDSKILFSIITSTYNRGYCISNLYNSLKRQSFNCFEWIVINDGSTDNTFELFSNWLKEDNLFKIRYLEQENKGLIRSLNKAIDLATGEYIIKVDSDDYLTDDCLKFFSDKIKTINGNVYAVGAQRGYDINHPIKGCWPLIDREKGYVDATDLERKKYMLDADMCEAWKTNVLKKYPFNVWENEKFAPEQITFYQIALDGYKIRWYAKVVCINDYKSDGLTKGADRLVKENPMGYAMMYDHMLNYKISFLTKCKAALQCDILCILSKNLKYINYNGNKFYKYIVLLFAVIWARRRKKQFDRI